jgi:hypothetical protein
MQDGDTLVLSAQRLGRMYGQGIALPNSYLALTSAARVSGNSEYAQMTDIGRLVTMSHPLQAGAASLWCTGWMMCLCWCTYRTWVGAVQGSNQPAAFGRQVAEWFCCQASMSETTASVPHQRLLLILRYTCCRFTAVPHV